MIDDYFRSNLLWTISKGHGRVQSDQGLRSVKDLFQEFLASSVDQAHQVESLDDTIVTI